MTITPTNAQSGSGLAVGRSRPRRGAWGWSILIPGSDIDPAAVKAAGARISD